MVRRVFKGAMLAGLIAVALTAAACSSKDGSGTGGSASAAGGSAALTVKDFAFDPSSVSVASGGTTITVTNEGTVVHSFTMDDGSVSQDVAPGASESVTVDVTADAGFHCRYHTQMTGTLTVG